MASTGPIEELVPTNLTQEANDWLDDMTDTDWLYDMEQIGPSPVTSMVTDTRNAEGGIFKSCQCPDHQEMYNDWPTEDAELTIAKCMKRCMYCGKDFPAAVDLRKHLGRRLDYASRNIFVNYETPGKGSYIQPSWRSRPRTAQTTSEIRTRYLKTRSVAYRNSQNLHS